MLCRHCDRPQTGNRPRGLCWPCYYMPGVRELYPPHANKFSPRGISDFCGSGSVPVPTDALPGTPEKVEILQERAQSKQTLWNSNDTLMDVT